MKYILFAMTFMFMLTGYRGAFAEHTVSYPENTVLGLTPQMKPNYPDCTSRIQTDIRCIDREESDTTYTTIMIPEKENPFPFKILRIRLLPERNIIGVMILKDDQTDFQSITQYYTMLGYKRTEYDVFRTDFYKILISRGYSEWDNVFIHTANYYFF